MNLLYRIYFALPRFDRLGLPGKAINRIMAFVLKRIFDAIVPTSLKRSASTAGFGLNRKYRGLRYIVSLTSFPARIHDVWITIDLILRQSFKPDAVILWLAKNQFPDEKVPDNLLSLTQRGLSIQFCDEDLRAHKKYYYAMQHYQDAIIITIDDDLYYDKGFLENLVIMHSRNPDCIVTNRAHQITFEENGTMKPYRKWQHNVTMEAPSHLLVATGGAGTLYPPGSLDNRIFDKQVFKELCFHADDIWLKVMALLNHTLIVTNRKYNKDFIAISTTQHKKLVSVNVLEGGNDKQLSSLLKHFEIKFEKGSF